MPTVLVIQHTPAEKLGRIDAILRERRIDVEWVRSDAPLPQANNRVRDGVIVLGGPMGVYDSDRYPRLLEEQTLLREAFAAHVPVLGICLGSQLLAASLGASVRPGPRKEIGWHDVTLTPDAQRDPLFADAPQRFAALHWHGDVFELPPGATRLASSALTTHQAFTHGDNVWALLFHLEADREQVANMIAAFPDELAAEGIDPEALRAATAQHADATQTLAESIFGRWAARVRR